MLWSAQSLVVHLGKLVFGVKSPYLGSVGCTPSLRVGFHTAELVLIRTHIRNFVKNVAFSVSNVLMSLSHPPSLSTFDDHQPTDRPTGLSTMAPTSTAIGSSPWLPQVFVTDKLVKSKTSCWSLTRTMRSSRTSRERHSSRVRQMVHLTLTVDFVEPTVLEDTLPSIHPPLSSFAETPSSSLPFLCLTTELPSTRRHPFCVPTTP